MGKQISFYLDDEEAVKRFMEKAALECRRPNDHARYVVLKSLGLAPDELSEIVGNLIDDYTVDKLNRTGELISPDLLEFKQWVSDRYK